ncbi:MAG TPA: STAS domain-containing protein [Gaiellaceae bacterium]|jgi:anti-anti-sigma factor|nr:STAS domain-containing protein [Gaiellaceae bacterium]
MNVPEPPLLVLEHDEPEPGVTQLVLRGECDLSEAARLAEAIEAVSPGAREVRLDISGLEFLDSTALRVLCRAKADLESARSRLVLLYPTPPIRRVLEIAGLWDFFRIEDGRSSSVSRLEASAP